MSRYLIGLLAVFFVSAVWCHEASEDDQRHNNKSTFRVIDLTHVIPTFQPLDSDPTKPDLSRPWGNSKPVPTFEQQAILSTSRWDTNQGFFDLATLHLAEHHGTHLDAPGHYINNEGSQEPGGSPPHKLKMVHQIKAKELVGDIVLIDISRRVRKELAKNGGKPSLDLAITDFSDTSKNVVTASDIAAVADDIDDGIWLVLNLGWSKFFNTGEADWVKSPYVNNWNHPGLSRAAVDKLIDIMEKKNVKIAGIVADNLSVDSGDSSLGDDDQWSNSWRGHVRLLQRQVMLVENASNLGKLSRAINRHDQTCTLVVGAIKHMRGTGAPARLLALCRNEDDA